MPFLPCRPIVPLPSIFIAAFIFFGSSTLLAAASPIHRTGALPFSQEVEAKLAPLVRPLTTIRPMATLPSKFKNITHLPVVREQMLNNCGAFTTSYYYKGYQEAREHGWVRPNPATHPERIMSPGFTYPLSNSGKDAGANPGVVMDIICRYGISTWATMPENGAYTQYPGEAAWRDGIRHRGKEVISIDLSSVAGIAALKQHLASGDPAVIGVLLYHDTYDHYPSGVGTDQQVIFDNGSDRWDWHAFTVIGYDDNKAYTAGGVAKKGAFLAVNSWGSGWGVTDPDAGSGGFVWFAYDYVRDRRGGSLAGGAYAMVDRIGYAPTTFAVFDLDVVRRRYLSMFIYPGSPGNKLADALPAFPTGGGDIPYAGRIVLDVTDFESADPPCYTLSYTDNSNYAGTGAEIQTGRLSQFTIEKPDGARIESPATPEEPGAIRAGVNAYLHAGPLWPTVSLLDEYATTSLELAWADWNGGPPGLAAGGGNLSNGRAMRLFRTVNAGRWGLLDLQTTLTTLTNAELDWADFDSDGFADLAAGGLLSYPNASLSILRNDQFGTFSDSGIALPGLWRGGVAWGDYNNDGRPDLAIAGTNSAGAAVTRLYRNTGATLVDSGASLPQQTEIDVSWADADNDGWLDLMLGARLLRNNRNGSFTQALDLGSGYQSMHAWGDYDNDGRLDLAFARHDPSASPPVNQIATAIYRNAGNFTFTNINAGLAGVRDGSLAWADFDANGLLDLALSGYSTNTWDTKLTRIYRQLPGGAFRDTGFDLADVAGGSTAWGDYNCDGSPDLLVTGHGPNNEAAGRFEGRTRFYVNQFGRADGANRPNSPPSAPAGLRAEWTADGRLLALKWAFPSDAETTLSAGLGYRVRVGTWPGGCNIVSPYATLSPAGPHPHCLIGAQPGRLLAGLPAGRYYWSVQAVDPGLAASPWSAEHSFTLGSAGLLDGDVNNDGRLDVADLVMTIQMANGAMPARADLADMNGNGRVDALDGWQIAQRLLASPGAGLIRSTPRPLGLGGGTLQAPELGLEIEVPFGSFAADASVAVEAEASPGEYGPDAWPMTWRIKGLPLEYSAPLKVRLTDVRSTPTAETWVAVGTPCVPKSVGESTIAYIPQLATRLPDGRLEITLPTPEPLAHRGMALAQATSDTLAAYEFIFVIHLLADSQWKYTGGHFTLIGPVGKKQYMAAAARDLEDAYAFYTGTLGFKLDARDWVNYPLCVTFRNLGKGSNGEPIAGAAASGLSYNGISMEINTTLMSERDYIRTTLAHEFFHVVQYLYDPRNRISRATTAPNLWFDEATAVYLENYFASAGQGHQPDLLRQYKYMIFGGFWQARKFFGSTAQNYGYGSAPLVWHLVRLNGNNPVIIHSIYQKIKEGTDGLSAVAQSAPGYPLKTWFTTLFEKIVSEEIYPGVLPVYLVKSDVATAVRTAKLDHPYERGVRFPQDKLTPLSAAPYVLNFDPAKLTLTSEDKLGVQVKGGDTAKQNVSLMLMHSQRGARTYQKLGESTYDSQRKVLRVEIPNAIQHVTAQNWIIPILSSTRDTDFSTEYPARLSFGIYRDYPNRTIPGHAVNLLSLYSMGQDLHWPSFTGQATYSANDVTLTREGITVPGVPNVVPTLELRLWGDPPQPVKFTYICTPSSVDYQTSIYDDFLESTYDISCSYLGEEEFRVNKVRLRTLPDGTLQIHDGGQGPWVAATVVDPQTNQISRAFDLQLDEEDMDYDAVDHLIDLRYRYRMIVRWKGTVLSTTTESRNGGVFDLRLAPPTSTTTMK